jgi:hypothetical protein
MFWKSIVGSLGYFLHWEFWLALVSYMGMFFLFSWAVLKISGEDENKQNLGCAFNAIFGPFYEGVTIGLFIIMLIPLVFGSGGLPSLSLLFGEFTRIALASAVSVVGIFLLSLIPVIGGLLNSIPTTLKFIQGIFVFRLLFSSPIEIIALSNGYESVQYPGLFASIGYLVIAALLGAAAIAALDTSMRRYSNSESDSDIIPTIFDVMMPTVGSFMGLFPLVMYMGYVRLSMGY